MENSESKYMQQALDIAASNASSTDGGPFGAVVVKDGRVVGAAGNSVTPSNDPTAHAEVNAIREACKELQTFDLSGATLYTSCEPCPMCLAAAYWANISKIYYAADRDQAARGGFDDAYIYDQFALPIEERSLPMVPLLEEKGGVPFDLWLENEQKRDY